MMGSKYISRGKNQKVAICFPDGQESAGTMHTDYRPIPPHVKQRSNPKFSVTKLK